MNGLIHGRITCDLRVFQQYFSHNQNDERLIMKVLCNRTPFTVERISPRTGFELGIASS